MEIVHGILPVHLLTLSAQRQVLWCLEVGNSIDL